MTNEQKQLLLTDLCARLPYGVKGYWTTKHPESIRPKVRILTPSDLDTEDVIKFKPYLRPLSSMTEEEKEKLEHLCNMFKVSDDLQDIRHGIHIIDEINGKLFPTSINSAVFDYLDSLYIDYRGLIEMSLALEAPEGMY